MWLAESAVVTAPKLLGAVLRRGPVAVSITEVEAYLGTEDPASHAWRGKTTRNAVMFASPGHLYCYTMHGHTCCNVVCSPASLASAVLIRAGRVIDGIEIARKRRLGITDHSLARGPGCLTKALGITMVDAGVDLLAEDSPVQLTVGDSPTVVSAGPRVGVSRAAEAPWRFWITDDPSVSVYKRSRALGPTATITR